MIEDSFNELVHESPDAESLIDKIRSGHHYHYWMVSTLDPKITGLSHSDWEIILDLTQVDQNTVHFDLLLSVAATLPSTQAQVADCCKK